MGIQKYQETEVLGSIMVYISFEATLECLINVPVRVFNYRKMPPYTGLIWHYTFIKKKKKKNFFFFFLVH